MSGVPAPEGAAAAQSAAGLEADVRGFLAQYCACLTNYDAPAAAALWVMPGLVVDDRYAGVVASPEELVRGLEQAHPFYRELGLASVGFELRALERLSERLTLVQVRWLFHDSGGQLLTDSFAHYLLRRGGDGMRACVCVQVDDLEKLEALARAKGVALPWAGT